LRVIQNNEFGESKKIGSIAFIRRERAGAGDREGTDGFAAGVESSHRAAEHASEKVAREPATPGYTSVKDYAAGNSVWIEAGSPIESDHKHQGD
jgi:hypothetical protein